MKRKSLSLILSLIFLLLKVNAQINPFAGVNSPTYPYEYIIKGGVNPIPSTNYTPGSLTIGGVVNNSPIDIVLTPATYYMGRANIVANGILKANDQLKFGNTSYSISPVGAASLASLNLGTAASVSGMKLNVLGNSYLNGDMNINSGSNALNIYRTGWSGSCKFGISGEFGWSRGLRFVVASDNNYTDAKDALYLESTGNVAMGISDPAGASLKIYRSQLPTFELANSVTKLQIGVVYSASNYAANSLPGDVVFQPINSAGLHKGLIFYLPETSKDGNSYIKFGDSGNNLWFGIFNNKTVRIDGTVTVKKVLVTTDVWSDVVFEPDYKLMSLNDIENFIKQNKHLPEVPTTKEVTESGIDVAQMNSILLKKIEEITLLMIEQDKTIKALQKKVDELQK